MDNIDDIIKTTAKEKIGKLEEELEQTDTEYNVLFDRMSKLRGTQFSSKNKYINKQEDSLDKKTKLNLLEEQLKHNVTHCELVSNRMSRIMINLRELEDELELVRDEYKTLYDNIKKLNWEYRSASVSRDFNTYL
jgi:archaellum component FlaC